jgi:fumarylacetoacetase
MASWIAIPPKSHFSLQNLPFGIITTRSNHQHRIAIAIGNYALDLNLVAQHQGFAKLAGLQPDHQKVFIEPTLNKFAALGRPTHRLVRSYLQDLLKKDTPYPELLRDSPQLREKALIPLDEVENHLPMAIGDYTDFFAGRNHAQTVGAMFRGPENALNPNYNHIPVAYHGRASSVVVSGTSLHRPKGQVLPAPGASAPVFKPCAKLDMELELGMFVAKGNPLGHSIHVDHAEEYVFGYVLMNDWSARDIQMWEYVPLGPFNAKNFGTTISPWVVLADALEPFKTTGLPNDVKLQDYLEESKKGNILKIQLEVTLASKSRLNLHCPELGLMLILLFI